jgi:hypothetical protein
MPFDPTYEIDDDTISIGDLVRVPGSRSDFIKDGETGTVIALGSHLRTLGPEARPESTNPSPRPVSFLSNYAVLDGEEGMR